MEILDPDLELLLKNLLEDNKRNVSKEDCEQSEIDSLIKNGYFEANGAETFDGWQYLITPTQKGKHYFSNKQKYIETLRHEENIQRLRFWIPVIISIAALAVSIITLCK